MKKVSLILIYGIVLLCLTFSVFASTTVKIPLDSMTVDEYDPDDNDCSNYDEEIYYDDDYSDEEYRAIMVLGFPSDYSNYIPSGKTIIKAVYYVHFDDEDDSGEIRNYASYSSSHSRCDSCMDWEDAFDDCEIDNGDRYLGNVDGRDNYWYSFDVTSDLRSAYGNNKFFALWHRGSSGSAGGDVEQDMHGEDSSSYYPYIEITYGNCNPSDVCCDTNGNYRPYGYSCGTCRACNGGNSCSVTPSDDSTCGTIDCDGLDTDCRNYNDITSNRCMSFGSCKPSNNPSYCTSYSNRPDGTQCDDDGAPSCDDTSNCIGHRYVCSAGLCNNRIRDDSLCGTNVICKPDYSRYTCKDGEMFFDGNVYKTTYNQMCTGQNTQGSCSGEEKEVNLDIYKECSASQYCESDGDTSCSDNHAPEWKNNLLDITLKKGTGVSEDIIDLKLYAEDYESPVSDLTYSTLHSSENISVSIDSDGLVNITTQNEWEGQETACFIVNDGFASSEEDCITMTVEDNLELSIPNLEITFGETLSTNLSNHITLKDNLIFAVHKSPNSEVADCSLVQDILNCNATGYGNTDMCINVSRNDESDLSCFTINVNPFSDYVLLNGDEVVWEGSAGEINLTDALNNVCTGNEQCNATFRIVSGIKDYMRLSNLNIEIEDRNRAPVIENAGIIPKTALGTDNLVGFCNSSDMSGDNLTLYYKWWNGSSLHTQGFKSNVPQGVELGVNMLSSSKTEKGETWIFSCMASDGIMNSTWVNSSLVIIQNSLPSMHTEYNMTVKEGKKIEINAEVEDDDKDNLTISMDDSKFNRTNNSKNNITWTWHTGYDDSGEYNITITVSDGVSDTIENLNISVINKNRAPALNKIENITLQPGGIVEINVSATDSDNENSALNDDNDLIYSLNDSRFTKTNNTFNTFKWQTNESDEGEYLFTATVSDGELTDRIIFSVTLAGRYILHFNQGWNLASLPIMQGRNVMIEEISEKIGDKLKSIFRYKNGNWKSFNPNRPPVFNNLDKLGNTEGAWFNLEEEADVNLSGVNDYPITYNLDTGWNMIGFPSIEETDITVALEDIYGKYKSVFGYSMGNWESYNPDRPPVFNNLHNLEPGKGYWINMKEEVTVEFDGTLFKVKE